MIIWTPSTAYHNFKSTVTATANGSVGSIMSHQLYVTVFLTHLKYVDAETADLISTP